MTPLPELLFRIALTVLVGGAIGAEREYRSKSAGFRTMILICLGSFLFTTLSINITGGTADRIASNIVTGIGFLGAGVIFRSDNRVNGLTTAASIWAVAALGMGIANGDYLLVGICTPVLLLALFSFTFLEAYIDRFHQVQTYSIQSTYKYELLDGFEEEMRSEGLNFKRLRQTKEDNCIRGVWLVRGKRKAHQRFVKSILHNADVSKFEF